MGWLNANAEAEVRWCWKCRSMCQEVQTTADPTRVGAALAALYPAFVLLWWDMP